MNLKDMELCIQTVAAETLKATIISRGLQEDETTKAAEYIRKAFEELYADPVTCINIKTDTLTIAGNVKVIGNL